MLGRVAIGIVVLLLMFAFASTINKGINTLRTDEVSKVASVVTTGGTSGDITLTRSLFNDNLTQIVSITSTDETDVPLASNYDSPSQVLTVSGLEAEQTRNITVLYYSEKTDALMQAVGPFLAFFIFGGIIAAIIYSIWQPGHKHGAR